METKTKRKNNYWPLGILGLLLFGVVLTLWTLYSASNNIVQMDNSYMANYHDVDKNYNELMAKKVEFNKNYILDLDELSLNLGKNTLNVKIFSKDIQPIENAKVTALITRPHTVQSDMKIEDFQYLEDGEYKSKSFELKDKGRWQIILKVEVGNYQTFEKVKFKNI
jgi:nitrogen fixation protein FixH